MAPRCKVCHHPERQAIDEAIVAGRSHVRIAEDYGGEFSHATVSRHANNHVSAALRAIVAERRDEGDRSLLERIEALLSEAEALLEAAKASGSVVQGLAAVRECRATVELLGKASGELKDGPAVAVVNLQTAPEWLAVRDVILRALEGHPTARAEVTSALLELGSGS